MLKCEKNMYILELMQYDETKFDSVIRRNWQINHLKANF